MDAGSDWQPLVEEGQVISLSDYCCDVERGQTVKVLVNGVETDAESFVAESGQIYAITVIVTDTDDSFTIWDVVKKF